MINWTQTQQMTQHTTMQLSIPIPPKKYSRSNATTAVCHIPGISLPKKTKFKLFFKKVKKKSKKTNQVKMQKRSLQDP